MFPNILILDTIYEMKIFLTIFILLSSSSVFAEAYVCTYNVGNITTPVILERNGEYFTVEGTSKSSSKIVFEDTNFIILGDEGKWSGYFGWRSIIINKKDKSFSLQILFDPEVGKKNTYGMSNCIYTN